MSVTVPPRGRSRASACLEHALKKKKIRVTQCVTLCVVLLCLHDLKLGLSGCCRRSMDAKAARKAERKAARKAERKAERKAGRKAARQSERDDSKGGSAQAQLPAQSDAVSGGSLNEMDAKIKALEAQLDAESSDEEVACIIVPTDKRGLSSNLSARSEPERKRARAPSDDSSSADEEPGLTCAICRISVNSREMMEAHLAGWKHKAEKKAKVPRAEGRYCEACGMAFTGPEQLAEHCKGRAHAEAVRGGGRGKGKGKGGGGGQGGGGWGGAVEKGGGSKGRGKGKGKGKDFGQGRKGKGGGR